MTTLNCIKDRNGYLWIPEGGNSNGLFKLDPKTGDYINYRHDPANPGSLSGNAVQSVFEDVQGNIWVDTWLRKRTTGPLYLPGAWSGQSG